MFILEDDLQTWKERSPTLSLHYVKTMKKPSLQAF